MLYKYVYRLGLKDDEEIESLKADISEKNLKYEELFVQPRAEAKDLYLQAKAKKGAKSVFAMFSLKKGFNFFKNLFKKIEYIDFVGFKLTGRIPTRMRTLTMFRLTSKEERSSKMT